MKKPTPKQQVDEAERELKQNPETVKQANDIVGENRLEMGNNDLKRIGRRIAVIETIVFAAFIAVLIVIISIFI